MPTQGSGCVPGWWMSWSFWLLGSPPSGEGQSLLSHTCSERWGQLFQVHGGGRISPIFLYWGHLDPLFQGHQENRVISLVRGLALPGTVRGRGSSALPLYFNAWFNAWFPWAPVVTQAKDINLDTSCSRNMDPDMANSSSLGPDVTMAPGDKQATHISLFFTTFTSSDLSLCTGYESFCLPLP